MYTLLAALLRLLLDGRLCLALRFDDLHLLLLLLARLSDFAEAIDTTGGHQTAVLTGVDGVAV